MTSAFPAEAAAGAGASRQCENCGALLRQKEFDWLFGCDDCQLLVSTLGAYEDAEATNGYEAADHAAAFGTLRKENAGITLDMLSDLQVRKGSRLLEVGSAQGFFLSVAEQHGFECSGIEPNRQLRESEHNKHRHLIAGFFPDALPDQQAFDLIVFNDVIEHIPDIRNTLKACHDHLTDDGLLIINVPMRRGFFYGVGKVAKTLGWKVPMERLWQVGTMSPHLYYFDESNLAELAQKADFDLATSRRLKTLTLRGLWSRLRVTSNFGVPTASVIWAATVIGAPFLGILPTDARVFAFRKRPAAPSR